MWCTSQIMWCISRRSCATPLDDHVMHLWKIMWFALEDPVMYPMWCTSRSCNYIGNCNVLVQSAPQCQDLHMCTYALPIEYSKFEFRSVYSQCWIRSHAWCLISNCARNLQFPVLVKTLTHHLPRVEQPLMCLCVCGLDATSMLRECHNMRRLPERVAVPPFK